MSQILNKVSGLTLVATLLLTLLGTSGSRAAAENTIASPNPDLAGSDIPAIKPLDPDVPPPHLSDGAIESSTAPVAPIADTSTVASSLEQLVADRVDTVETTNELKCLAGAIYFEARSESLEGQLAVGRVIVARAHSGRFPTSYCGVVYQPSQFSFVHRAAMPSVDTQSHFWLKAMALARIADAGSWQSPAEGALFFHVARVGNSAGMTRVAQIDHHVFYR